MLLVLIGPCLRGTRCPGLLPGVRHCRQDSVSRGNAVSLRIQPDCFPSAPLHGAQQLSGPGAGSPVGPSLLSRGLCSGQAQASARRGRRAPDLTSLPAALHTAVCVTCSDKVVTPSVPCLPSVATRPHPHGVAAALGHHGVVLLLQPFLPCPWPLHAARTGPRLAVLCASCLPRSPCALYRPPARGSYLAAFVDCAGGC